MNPLTNIRNITKLNETEQQLGVSQKSSWHQQYKDSAYIYVGGLPYDLTEGDIICAFSQFGEVVDINLVRDKKTGKSKGFCFLCYEDQRSTILSVDNFNGIKLLGRTLRVDHVSDYRRPKEFESDDPLTQKLRAKGVIPGVGVTEEDTDMSVAGSGEQAGRPRERRSQSTSPGRSESRHRGKVRTEVKRETAGSSGAVRVKKEWSEDRDELQRSWKYRGRSHSPRDKYRRHRSRSGSPHVRSKYKKKRSRS